MKVVDSNELYILYSRNLRTSCREETGRWRGTTPLPYVHSFYKLCSKDI